MRARATVLGACLAGLLAAAGCCEPPPETVVSVDRIVADYNANAAAVPRLWARAKIAVTVRLDSGMDFSWGSTSPLALPNSLLLLAKGPQTAGPVDFLLIGRETAAVEVFRLGTSAAEGLYYFWARFGEHGGAWFGQTKLAGAPGARHLPIDPLQLLSVLAICELPADSTSLPAVALTMQARPCENAYVLTYVDRQPLTGRIVFRREVLMPWSDREPRRPYRVNLFDNAGRRVMTAHLKDYRPVELADVPEGGKVQPVMPTDIEIVANSLPGMEMFVQRVHIVLSEMTTADKWDSDECRFRPPGALEPVEVDAGLTPASRPATNPGAGR